MSHQDSARRVANPGSEGGRPVSRPVGRRAGRPVAGPRGGAIGPALLLLALLGLGGCASSPIDYASAVKVRILNPTPMRVWVQFSRSAGGSAWTRSVGPRKEAEYLVRHRAFGTGPVRVHLIRWPGALHLTKVYRGRDALHVPPGSLIEVRLARDLRATTVWMAEDRPPPEAVGEVDVAGPVGVRFELGR